MKYFVTGATGFIGGKLAFKLREMGHEVNALVRDKNKAGALAANGIKIFEGDITKISTLYEPMKNVDGIFHAAAWYKVGVKDKSKAYDTNVRGTRSVLEAMKELGIRKGVYTSTLAVNSNTKGRLVDETYRFDGKHLSEYDRTKWLAHFELADRFISDGLPLVIVMPGLTYGPGDTSQAGDSFKQYLQGKLPSLPKKAAVCWAHVDDIVMGHILAMDKGKPGESYIIAGPSHTFIEAFQIAEKITGIRAPRMNISPGMIKTLSFIMKGVERIIPLPSVYSSEALRVVAGVTYLGDNSKAKRELGYTVRPLEAGLKETLGSADYLEAKRK